MAGRVPVSFPQLEEIEFCSSRSDLVTQHDGHVFVCNPDNSHIYTFHHRDLAPGKPPAVQELVLTQVPNFTVSHISASTSGSKLLLWSERGVAVVEVPKRRRPKGSTMCRCIQLGCRFFEAHSRVAAVEVQWHPASTEENHVAVLTTDNILRLYSTEEPAAAIASYPLFDSDSILPYLHCLNVSTGPSLITAQSGSMVSFSFGPADEDFPVFVLEENSDIHILRMPLSATSNSVKLEGPLRVLPPDNSTCELDYCSILALGCSPPVLACASLTGTIHHLALLSSGDEDEEECLYLLESFSLDLPEREVGGSSVGCEEEEEEGTVTLIPDQTSFDRYFVRTSTGVYSVFMPSIHRLQTFVKDETGELNLECESTVEHLLCVQPVGESDPTCLFGSALLQDPVLGSSLLVLISNAEFIQLPLRSVTRETIPLLSSSGEGKEAPASPMKQLYNKPFNQRIQGILDRTVSNPMLRSGNSGGMSQKALLELLLKCTQVFREEYVGRQSKARTEILLHMTLLQDQHSQHRVELAELEDGITELRSDCTALSSRSSAVSKRQQSLQERVSKVTREVQNLLPDLSDAENSLREEISDLSKRKKCLQNDTEQLRSKLKFQTATARKFPVMSGDQQGRVKAILQENDDKINSLVNKLKGAQIRT